MRGVESQEGAKSGRITVRLNDIQHRSCPKQQVIPQSGSLGGGGVQGSGGWTPRAVGGPCTVGAFLGRGCSRGSSPSPPPAWCRGRNPTPTSCARWSRPPRRGTRPGPGVGGTGHGGGQGGVRGGRGHATPPHGGLTALEKASEPTPRSKVPRPICCSVRRVLESQMWTMGWRGCGNGGGFGGGCPSPLPSPPLSGVPFWGSQSHSGGVPVPILGVSPMSPPFLPSPSLSRVSTGGLPHPTPHPPTPLSNPPVSSQ